MALGLGIELWLPSPKSNGLTYLAPSLPAAPARDALPDRTDRYASEVLARPLFTQARRPLGKAPMPAAPGPAETLPRLSGVMISGSLRRAIFEVGSASVAGGVGSAVGDYRIIEIAPSRVTLLGPKGIRTLGLAFDAKPPPPPPLSVLDQLNSGQRAPAAMPKPVTIEQLMATLPKSPP